MMMMMIRMKDPPLDQTGGLRDGEKASASESAFVEEPVQTTSQIEKPSQPVFETGAEDQPIVQSSQHPEWFSQPKKPLTLDRDWNKTLPAVQGSTQTWISELAKQADSHSSFNELLYTPLDFSNFIMNWLRVDTLTPELLARPTFELMMGSCTSLIELEYHLEEVYKATTDQLDWVNPEGQQYTHNLLQPLPLISDNRGRRVIPFAHFINNDLEYLRGGASSRKYTTSVTKTKAADYRIIKWIEDLVPRTIWIREPIDYDKHALWGVPHWGRKRKLSNLTVEERFAFNASLRMFTRRIVIQRSDKIILDSYRETFILKRRRDDDDDQDEGPSAGLDQGSKRWREGKEPESASAPLETTTRSAGRELAKQADSRSSFNKLLDTPLDFSNFIMNRLRVDTLTPELLAGPTFKLMKGLCTSMIELEYHLEEVYKATTDQLDWVNPKGQ
nr:hypothetical protein [Tanacetum cinerariifolium]